MVIVVVEYEVGVSIYLYIYYLSTTFLPAIFEVGYYSTYLPAIFVVGSLSSRHFRGTTFSPINMHQHLTRRDATVSTFNINTVTK